MAKAMKSDLRLMPGSSTGATYLAFARKGGVLLGIKPWGIARGERFGVPNTTYFAARLRSAPEGGLFKDLDAATKVVKLQPNPANLWDAWPGVSWENKGADRASTTIGAFMPGYIAPDEPVRTQELFDGVGDGKLAQKLADYLITLAGSEFVIISVDELKGWLDQEYQEWLTKAKEVLDTQQKVADAAKKSVGAFGMQAALLKQFCDTAVSADETKAEDLPADPEDEDPDDADQYKADDEEGDGDN